MNCLEKLLEGGLTRANIQDDHTAPALQVVRDGAHSTTALHLKSQDRWSDRTLGIIKNLCKSDPLNVLNFSIKVSPMPAIRSDMFCDTCRCQPCTHTRRYKYILKQSMCIYIYMCVYININIYIYIFFAKICQDLVHICVSCV